MNAKDKRLAAARVIRLAITSGEYGDVSFMCPALGNLARAGTISVLCEEAGLLHVRRLMNAVCKSHSNTLNDRLRRAYGGNIPTGSMHPELYLRYADWLESGGYLTKAKVKAICDATNRWSLDFTATRRTREEATRYSRLLSDPNTLLK